VSEPLKLKRQKPIGSSKSKREYLSAVSNPLASVLVDTPVSHLEGIYDYLVPEELSISATIGTKVLVEFGNSQTEGLIVARGDRNGASRVIKPILAISSPSGIVQPSILQHIELVRNRFGGSFWSLLKQAIPPRVVKEENFFNDLESNEINSSNSDEIRGIIGRADHAQLKSKEKIRWGVNLPVSTDPIWFVLEIVKLRASIGQVLLLVPDEKDLNSFRSALQTFFGDNFTEYGSHISKNVRYQNFLKISSKTVRVILSSRSGSFLPLAPDATVIVLSDLDKRKGYKRAVKHNYRTSDNGLSYIAQIKKAFTNGNVLVSVAEKGYANLFLCSKCRNTANCECGGKLQIDGDKKIPQCYLCCKVFNDWKCNFCGDSRPYVISKGIDRTAEEIGKALSKASILISSGTKQIDHLPDGRHVILATAGSEPNGEYSAVVMLDGERIFNRPTLRSEELAKHLWFSLLCKANSEAEIFMSLQNNHPLVQSILRNDSSYLAKNQLKERKQSKLPPYYRVASVEGRKADISKFAENLRSSSVYEVTGPMVLKNDFSKLIIRSPLEQASELVDLLDDVVKVQSIKGKGIFKVRFDQFDI
jgi:primosomal protein N' (replication factor Y)